MRNRHALLMKCVWLKKGEKENPPPPQKKNDEDIKKSSLNLRFNVKFIGIPLSNNQIWKKRHRESK